MVAATQSVEDYDLTFRNVGSYLLVKLYGKDQTVESIAITAKGGEALAGKAYITPAYQGVPTTEMVGTTSTVTLKSESGVTVGSTKETATAFWAITVVRRPTMWMARLYSTATNIRPSLANFRSPPTVPVWVSAAGVMARM